MLDRELIIYNAIYGMAAYGEKIKSESRSFHDTEVELINGSIRQVKRGLQIEPITQSVYVYFFSLGALNMYSVYVFFLMSAPVIFVIYFFIYLGHTSRN